MPYTRCTCWHVKLLAWSFWMIMGGWRDSLHAALSWYRGATSVRSASALQFIDDRGNYRWYNRIGRIFFFCASGEIWVKLLTISVHCRSQSIREKWGILAMTRQDWRYWYKIVCGKCVVEDVLVPLFWPSYWRSATLRMKALRIAIFLLSVAKLGNISTGSWPEYSWHLCLANRTSTSGEFTCVIISWGR